MPRYVALLRGVNVGPRTKVPMARLRELVVELGYDDVETHLNSGNVVLSASERSAAKVADAISASISDDLGLDVPVLIRTRAQLDQVVDGNPYLDRGVDPKELHVGFLGAKPAAAAVKRLDPDRSPPDEFTVAGREVYLRYPNGLGRSKLSGDYLERRLDTPVTIRNWRTTVALLDLVSR